MSQTSVSLANGVVVVSSFELFFLEGDFAFPTGREFLGAQVLDVMEIEMGGAILGGRFQDAAKGGFGAGKILLPEQFARLVEALAQFGAVLRVLRAVHQFIDVTAFSKPFKRNKPT